LITTETNREYTSDGYSFSDDDWIILDVNFFQFSGFTFQEENDLSLKYFEYQDTYSYNDHWQTYSFDGMLEYQYFPSPQIVFLKTFWHPDTSLSIRSLHIVNNNNGIVHVFNYDRQRQNDIDVLSKANFLPSSEYEYEVISEALLSDSDGDGILDCDEVEYTLLRTDGGLNDDGDFDYLHYPNIDTTKSYGIDFGIYYEQQNPVTGNMHRLIIHLGTYRPDHPNAYRSDVKTFRGEYDLNGHKIQYSNYYDWRCTGIDTNNDGNVGMNEPQFSHSIGYLLNEVGDPVMIPGDISPQTDFFERYRWRSNPLSSDTDKDGLADDLDPDPTRVTDSDNDGVPDGFDQGPNDENIPGIAVKYRPDMLTRNYFCWNQNGYAFTDIVIRRGTHFIVEAPANSVVDIAPFKINPPLSLIDLRNLGNGQWQVTIGGTDKVGKYKITSTKGTWTKSMNMYVIFELPLAREGDDDIDGLSPMGLQAYCYDEYGTRDEWDIAHWRKYNGDYNTVYHNQENENILNPFSQFIVDLAITATSGETEVYAFTQSGAAQNIETVVENIVWYEDWRGLLTVEEILHTKNYDPARWDDTTITNNPITPTDIDNALTSETTLISGQCCDYARIVEAFCRATGIPARSITAIDYDSGPYWRWHAWIEFFSNNQWIVLDATDYPDEASVARGIEDRTSYFYANTHVPTEIITGTSNWVDDDDYIYCDEPNNNVYAKEEYADTSWTADDIISIKTSY